MFRKMPFILLITIFAIVVLNFWIPLAIKEILYALSLTIKSAIILLLPFIIFGLLFKTVVGLANRATAIIGVILISVCCSNATSTFLSHFVGSWIYHFNLALILPKHSSELTPAWTWTFPSLLANNKAMFAGVILGFLTVNIMPKMAQHLAAKLDIIIGKILSSFIYFIPLFVAGFVIKLQFDGVMQIIIKDYVVIFMLVALAQFGYIFLAYFLLSKFNLYQALHWIKNMLPAAMTGFSTMSSAAAMPLTITGVGRNAKNKDLARSVVPATVNIHLIGDCFAIPIFAYAVMKSFGMPQPALTEYLVFVFYFVIAKFSVAAIPGGGIVVMLPILESCLGFNAQMLSMITALYVLFDPVITCANVLGNGAFAKWIDRLMSLKFLFSSPLEKKSKESDVSI